MKPPEIKIAGDKAVVTAEGGKVVSQKVETRAAKRTKEGWNVVPSDERLTKKALPPKMAEVSVKQTSANVQPEFDDFALEKRPDRASRISREVRRSTSDFVWGKNGIFYSFFRLYLPFCETDYGSYLTNPARNNNGDLT